MLGEVPRRYFYRRVRSFHLLSSSADDEDDEYRDATTIWLTQDELIEHVNSIGCTLDLPPFSLSSTQAAQLVRLSVYSNAQRSELQSLQKMYEGLEAEYKKYRVDMGERCDGRLTDRSVDLEQGLADRERTCGWRSVSVVEVHQRGAAAVLRAAGAGVAGQSLKEKNSELTRTVDGLKLDVEELKLNAENDKRKLELLKNECDEWRRKYKEEVKVDEACGREV